MPISFSPKLLDTLNSPAQPMVGLGSNDACKHPGCAEAYRCQASCHIMDHGAPERVILTRGWITVTTVDKADTRRVGELLMGSYRRQAQRVFHEQWAEVAPRIATIGVTLPESFRLREMKSRWGSCSSKGQISLNLKLIQVDKSLIDYVILHELCHLRELNHSRAFYTLLDRVVPDWKQLRAKLNKSEVSF